VGPRNHVLFGGPNPPWEGLILRWERGAPLSAIGTLVICAKTAVPIQDAIWVVGLDGPKELWVRWWSSSAE